MEDIKGVVAGICRIVDAVMEERDLTGVSHKNVRIRVGLTRRGSEFVIDKDGAAPQHFIEFDVTPTKTR